MCRPIFGSGKAVVFDSGFCVAKGITYIKDKGLDAVDMIKKLCYWRQGVHGDLIDNQFEDKEFGYVGTIETRIEDNKLLIIFLTKEPDYVMKIMASWMILDE